MADEKPQLLVRIVDPEKIISKRIESGGTPESKWYIPEADTEKLEAHRMQLVGELAHIEFPETTKKKKLPIILKARLKSKALAKSNRPESILSKETCPVVGVEDIGQLLLSATENRLYKLKSRINEAKDKELAQVTAIDDISPFKIEDKLSGETLDVVKKLAKRNDYWILKVTLFDHEDPYLNQIVTEGFSDLCEQNSIKFEQVSKVVNIKTLKIEVKDEQSILLLLDYAGVKELSYFPTYKIVSNAFETTEKKIQFPKPDSNKKYPIIGLIDSGIPEQHKALTPWIEEHLTYIPTQESNYNHGCFVGGLLAFGNFLVGDYICPEKDNTKIVDIHVLPSDIVENTLTEDKLIARLDDAVPKLIGKYGVKIFNMSIGFPQKICEVNTFSTLAVYLDKLQDKYDVIFVLPSGNNKELKHQRAWPPVVDQSPYDKLRAPADSLRAITVGALAAKERKDSFVKKDEVTSYSCIGPGPAYTIKPDVVHYSGNISVIKGQVDFSLQGMQSVNEHSRIVEDVGTSFSAPMISRTLGILDGKLLEKPSAILLKALLIHSAGLPAAIEDEPKILKYVGFGLPKDSERILSCNEHEVTLVFEKAISLGSFVECLFYWPPSLIRNGKCYGEMELTVVSKTPLDERYGSEYARANVTATIQAQDLNGVWGSREIPEYPTTSQGRKIFETDLIEALKWKPIKQYKRMLVKGVPAKAWRLRVNAKFRNEFKPTADVPFAMIFTLKDPEGKAPVYNEVVNEMRIHGINTYQVRLRTRVQV